MPQWKRWFISKLYSLLFHNSFQTGSVTGVITTSPRLNKCQMQWQDALSLGYGCISSLIEELVPGRNFLQKTTNSSTSEFWFSSAWLCVESLWPNENKTTEKKEEACISFSTSGTRVPAGLLCAACREYITSGVFFSAFLPWLELPGGSWPSTGPRLPEGASAGTPQLTLS